MLASLIQENFAIFLNFLPEQCAEETARLEQPSAHSNQVLKLKAEKKAVMAETHAGLAIINPKDLRSHALVKAEENRKQKSSSLGNKLLSYEKVV